MSGFRASWFSRFQGLGLEGLGYRVSLSCIDQAALKTKRMSVFGWVVPARHTSSQIVFQVYVVQFRVGEFRVSLS